MYGIIIIPDCGCHIYHCMTSMSYDVSRTYQFDKRCPARVKAPVGLIMNSLFKCFLSDENVIPLYF